MKLKNNLSLLLELNGVSITFIAKKTSVPAQTIHNWITGATPRSMEQVKAVADFFNITIDALCYRDINKSKEKLTDYYDEINAGVFEVVLRKIKK